MTPYSIEVRTAPDVSAWLADLVEFFKQHVRYQEGDAEDTMLLQYLGTSIDLFELHTAGRVVLATGFTQYSPTWACGWRNPMRLERAAVTEISEVRYYDTADEVQTLDAGDYGTDTTGIPALVWHKGGGFPALSSYRPRPVAVDFEAGWEAEAVPDSVKTGLFLLAAHFYEHRGDEDTGVDIPPPFLRLCNLWHTGLS
ncbi:hypothetical protein J0H58_20375 [bacterium]|nr:hypothetical protein [bacterium]